MWKRVYFFQIQMPQSLEDRFHACARADGSFGQFPAKGACAGDALDEPDHVPRDCRKLFPRCKLVLDIGQHPHDRGGGVKAATRLAKDALIDGEKQGRVLLSRAPKHDAIDKLQMRLGFVQVHDAAIDDNRQVRPCCFQPVDAFIVERRHVAVLPRAQAL